MTSVEGENSDAHAVRVTVTEELDLHTWRPRDLPDLLPEWFSECRRLGILTVRVIHGKGTGSLRSGVHAFLPRLTEHVASWTHPAPDAAGGWGATLVHLHPKPEKSESHMESCGKSCLPAGRRIRMTRAVPGA